MATQTNVGTAKITLQLDTQRAQQNLDALEKRLKTMGVPSFGPSITHPTTEPQIEEKKKEESTSKMIKEGFDNVMKAARTGRFGTTGGRAQQILGIVSSSLNLLEFVAPAFGTATGAALRSFEELHALMPGPANPMVQLLDRFANYTANMVEEKTRTLSNEISNVRARIESIGPSFDQVQDILRSRFALGESFTLSDIPGLSLSIYKANEAYSRMERQKEKFTPEGVAGIWKRLIEEGLGQWK